MAILATIRRWNTCRAWDVQPGDEYVLEREHVQQDGFAYRAVRMWPAGTAPVDPVVRHDSSAYRSSLTLDFDED